MKTKKKHRSGWFGRGEGKNHFFDNDKRDSLCGSISLKPSEYKQVKHWAFAPNSCKRCDRMMRKT